jgi:PII-like signaling protein
MRRLRTGWRVGAGRVGPWSRSGLGTTRWTAGGAERAARPARAGRDLRRRVPRSGRAGAAGRVAAARSGGVAVANVRREHRRSLPARLLRDPAAGAPATVGLLVGAIVGEDAFRLAGTGFLGAYTTFSTWALESHRLGENGQRALGLINFAASLILRVLAAWTGEKLGTLRSAAVALRGPAAGLRGGRHTSAYSDRGPGGRRAQRRWTHHARASTDAHRALQRGRTARGTGGGHEADRVRRPRRTYRHAPGSRRRGRAAARSRGGRRTVLLGVDGTAHGTRQRGRFFGANAQVPLMIISVGQGDRIARVLPELAAMLRRPLVTLERVRVCKRDGQLLSAPPRAPETDASGLRTWTKLMVYCSEQSRHDGRPLYRELVRRLREAGAIGATALRGIWGYHGDHRPHGDHFLQLQRRRARTDRDRRYAGQEPPLVRDRRRADRRDRAGDERDRARAPGDRTRHQYRRASARPALARLAPHAPVELIDDLGPKAIAVWCRRHARCQVSNNPSAAGRECCGSHFVCRTAKGLCRRVS